MNEEAKGGKAHFRASHAGICPRRLQHEVWGTEEAKPWEGTERAFYDGRMHEASILEYAAQRYDGGGWKVRLAQKEMRLESTKCVVTGHIDGVLWRPGERVLVEAKALSRRGFIELRQTGVLAAQPQYYTQVQLYLAMLQGTRWKTDGALLVYRNRETPRNRMYDHGWEEIIYDPDYVRQILESLDWLAEQTRRGNLVNVAYHPDNTWRCRPPWCPYTQACWPGWMRRREQAQERTEYLPLVERRQELQGAINEAKRELDDINEQLKDGLDEGTYQIGKWTLEVQIRRQERVNARRVREVVSPDLLPSLITVSEYKVLNVESEDEEEE